MVRNESAKCGAGESRLGRGRFVREDSRIARALSSHGLKQAVRHDNRRLVGGGGTGVGGELGKVYQTVIVTSVCREDIKAWYKRTYIGT